MSLKQIKNAFANSKIFAFYMLKYIIFSFIKIYYFYIQNFKYLGILAIIIIIRRRRKEDKQYPSSLFKMNTTVKTKYLRRFCLNKRIKLKEWKIQR